MEGTQRAHIDHPHIVKSVDFSPDDARLASGGQDKHLRLFELARIDAGASAQFLHAKGVRKVVWAPDGRGVYTGGEDGVVRLWDLASGTVAHECAAAAAPIMDMELSAAHGMLIVAAGQSVLLLAASPLALLRKFDYRYAVESASLLPSAAGVPTHFVTGGADVHVHVYDAATGDEVATDRGHHGTIHCVRVSPDRATYSSGAADATVRIWQADADRWTKPPASGAS